MNITILYFAALKEALGLAREEVSLPGGISSAGELRAWLGGRGAAWGEALGEGRNVQVAVDRVLADAATPLRDGAEVAFFPPVTGG
jgi:molybdopterin synthase sulfur carrier subunit